MSVPDNATDVTSGVAQSHGRKEIVVVGSKDL